MIGCSAGSILQASQLYNIIHVTSEVQLVLPNAAKDVADLKMLSQASQPIFFLGDLISVGKAKRGKVTYESLLLYIHT